MLRALGRGSPTVAPLRVRAALSVMVERGGDLLRRPPESTHAPPAMYHVRRTASRLYCQSTSPARAQPRPTIPRTARAAPVPPGRQRTSDTAPSPLQAAPARKVLALRNMRFLPQAKRRGARGQPWCCLGLAAPGRPLVLSREWERTAPHICQWARGLAFCRKESCRAPGQGIPSSAEGKSPSLRAKDQHHFPSSASRRRRASSSLCRKSAAASSGSCRASAAYRVSPCRNA